MASLIFKGAPSDDPDKPRKIPKVAVYVAGAAFALSTGLTLLILPFVRQAARLNASSTQFLSNRNLLREPTVPPISSRIPRPDTSLPEVKVEAEDPAVRSSRGFNDREEKELYGAPLQEGEEQPIGGLMGIQALGIATAVVFGTAGLGAWVVGKMMGVGDMDEFATKMRETLQLKMPVLSQAVNRPDDPPASGSEVADAAARAESAQLRQWLKEIDEAVLEEDEPLAQPS